MSHLGLPPLGPQRSALLRELQAGMESLYRLDPAPDVTGFLLSPARLDKSQEQLVLIEGDDLQLGLALDPAAVARLADDYLSEHNLHPFSLVVEGISHFLFMMHRARRDQPTSILELELQAEVDKYVAAMMLTRRCPRLHSERLRRRLYAHYRLVEGLALDERARYHHANHLARRYARRLERRFVRAQQLPAMLAELRRFYRMSCRGKRDLIARAS